jgi:hypothetical protein
MAIMSSFDKRKKNDNDTVVDTEEDVDLEAGTMAANKETMMMMNHSEENNMDDSEVVDDGTILRSNDEEEERVIYTEEAEEEEEHETCMDHPNQGIEDENVPTAIHVEGGDKSNVVPVHSSSSATRREELSTIFHCPITKPLFQDPVVASDGITYERRAIRQRDSEKVTIPPSGDDDDFGEKQPLSQYYPNRALQQVLTDRLLLIDTVGGEEEEAWMPSNLVERQQDPTTTTTTSTTTITIAHYRSIPDAYHCPITFGIMHDPVIDPEGNTYERRAIQLWIRANHNCPLSRKPLQESQLYDNQAVRQVLHEEAERSEDLMHPAIREWKHEPKPKPLPPLDASSLMDKVAATTSTTSGGGGVEPTPEELEALRRQQVVETRVFTIFCVCLLCLTIYIIPYGTVLVLIYMLLVCLYANIPHHAAREAPPRFAASATTTSISTTTTAAATPITPPAEEV